MNAQAKVRLEINLDKAKALGLRFCAERNARQCSTQDIADHLLLSKPQVLGLETGNHQSFYSVKMFGQAADKYALYLGFEEKPSLSLFGNDPEPAQVVAEAGPRAETVVDTDVTRKPETATPRLPQTQTSARRFGLRVALVGICIIGVVTLLYKVTQTEAVIASPKPEPVTQAPEPPPAATPPTPPTENNSATGTPTAPTPNTSDKSEPIKVEPEKAAVAVQPVASEAVATGLIQIKFNESSWVQSVDKDGRKQEKVYLRGETLELAPASLQALVIGNADAVIVTSGSAPISLKPYMASGSQVARIMGPAIRKLGD